MGTQLLLVVGTNPLPVWVACQYLHKLLEPPVSVRMVYTENTQDEARRLQDELSSVSFLDAIKTSPGNPAVVRNDVRSAVAPLPPGTTHVHVHYTGGTKVMAVETVTALERYREQCQDAFRVDTSYLDPRGETGPTLINQQGHKLIQDTRQAIRHNLLQIAQLNGFVIGPFTHLYYRQGKPIRRPYPEPTVLSEQQRQAGRVALTEARGKWDRLLGDFRKK